MYYFYHTDNERSLMWTRSNVTSKREGEKPCPEMVNKTAVLLRGGPFGPLVLFVGVEMNKGGPS